MPRFADALYVIAITLWVGGLWAIGYLAAPALFSALSDRALAGQLAGRMFTLLAWAGMGCGAYLIAFLAVRRGWSVFKSGAFWIVVLMLALTVAGHFGVQPVIERLKLETWPRQAVEGLVRNRFAVWHGVASVLYLMQSLIGLVLAVRFGDPGK